MKIKFRSLTQGLGSQGVGRARIDVFLYYVPWKASGFERHLSETHIPAVGFLFSELQVPRQLLKAAKVRAWAPQPAVPPVKEHSRASLGLAEVFFFFPLWLDDALTHCIIHAKTALGS